MKKNPINFSAKIKDGVKLLFSLQNSFTSLNYALHFLLMSWTLGFVPELLLCIDIWTLLFYSFGSFLVKFGF